MTVHVLEDSPVDDTASALRMCCGCERWVTHVQARLPVRTMRELHALADEAFGTLGTEDWLEAFSHHPEIGDVDRLRERFAASGTLSEREQAGVGAADDELLAAIARGNVEYRQRFGFVFLVRAAGRSAREIFDLQQERLRNDRDTELRIAADQQREIAHLRLAELFTAAPE